MSILIKGVEMPERCIDCELCNIKVIGALHTACIICRHNGEEIAFHGRRDDCPLVELPPHGRLIDADALMKYEENVSYKDEWHMTVTDSFVSVENIVHAPTIIESEKEA